MKRQKKNYAGRDKDKSEREEEAKPMKERWNKEKAKVVFLMFKEINEGMEHTPKRQTQMAERE